MDQLIKTYLQTHSLEDFFFIQIGANDGVSGDPIHEYIKKYLWKGILVEPVPFLFKKLQETYKGVSGLSFENVAIGAERGHSPFYRIARQTEPEKVYWFDQLGSFKKEVVLKHWENIPEEDKHFETKEVEVITFSDLLEKYKPTKIDFLHIDTEGHDFEIIKLIPFEKLKPAMILYEHRHLSEEDKRDSLSLLAKQGYEILEMEFDVFAYYNKNL